MKLILHTTHDHFSDYGYQYFKNTFGFNPEASNFIVFTPENTHSPDNNSKKIQGWIQIGNKKIPVFKVPADLSNLGKPLLFYNNKSGNYPCAVETADSIIVSIDIFYHLGFCLSGNLEYTWEDQQELRCDLITIPFMDYYANFLFDIIRQIYSRLQIPFVHTAFWPEGKTCAVCLTHDVDEVKKTYQWISYPIKRIKRGNFAYLIPQLRSFIQKLKGHEPYWTFDEIIRIEGERDVKSSFYFLKESGKVRISDRKTWRHYGRRYSFNNKQMRELLRGLHSKGWDVGLHGSFYSYLDREKLLHEKEALENSLGASVFGGRQHNLNLKIPETWLNQEYAGLLYDTTLGYNDCLGFRWGISFPFRPYYPEENRGLNVLQIPLAIEDLPYFRHQQPFEEFLNLFNNVEQSHGVMTLLWHHSVFNENEFPGWASDYEKIINYCKKQNAWIGSGKQIYEWWIQREKTTINWDYDDKVLKISPSPGEMQHFIKIYLPDSTQIRDVKNATVISGDHISYEIKTNVLQKGECIEITFSEF